MLQHYFEKFGHSCKLNLNAPFDKYKVNKSRLRLWFMENSTISPKYILLRSCPRSFAQLRNEKLWQLEHYPNTVHPFSAITFYFELMWMFVVFLWLLLIPLDLFDDLYVDLLWKHEVEYLEICLATLSILDIFRRFCTGYLIRHCDSDEIVLDLRRISFHYLKSFFLIDFMSSLSSFVGLMFLTTPNLYLAVELFSCVRIFRLASMLRIFKNVMHFYKFNEHTVEIVDAVLILWFVVHWVSCFSIMMGIVETRFDPDLNQWYSDLLIPGMTLAKQYIICLHRTISIISSLGYNFPSKNIAANDMIYTIFTAVLGHILSLILIAKVHEIVTGARCSYVKYDEMLNEVSQYVNHKTWKKTTQNKIKTYYAYKYEHSYFGEHLILAATPKRLRETVELQNAKLLLDHIKYFQRLPASMVAKIVTHFAKEILLAGDIVYKNDESDKSIYFLLHGTVAEFSAGGREIMHLQDGSQFGESVFTNATRKHSCTMVAIEPCELLKVSPAKVRALIDYCPDLIELMEKEVNDRKEKADTINERYQQLKSRSSRSLDFNE